MAQLQDPKGRIVLLLAHHLVGRSRAMHIQLSAAAVSAQHAAFNWTERGWTLRDLGSRNGTWLNGERLVPGQDVATTVGASIEFGAPEERYTLITDAPPSPSARHGDHVVEGSPDLLPLPSPDAPLVLIYWLAGTGWVRVADELEIPVRDGEALVVEGASWVLSLPEPLIPTVNQHTRLIGVEHLSLKFRVSADEEHVQLEAAWGPHQHSFPPRSHHYLLLTLARARFSDQKAGVSDAEAGWRTSSELARMLRCSTNQVYVSLHRSRRELEALDGLDGAAVLERRELSRQVRLAAGTMVVEAA